MLAFVVTLATALAALTNHPPNTPVITEPVSDGRIVNPEDVHMQTAPFSDPDPGDVHVASDWELWTITPSQRVWSALNITGIEKVHIHLGDGTFEGSHAGRHSLLPSTNYRLRARHKDSSGDPLTQWSDWGLRTFVTGSLSTVFPLQLDDAADTPVPAWSRTVGGVVALPGGASPAVLTLGSATGQVVLTFTGTGAGTQVMNPAALSAHIALRVRLSAGTQGVALPETDVTFTDHLGADQAVYLPAVNLAPGQSAYWWVSSNGSTYVAQAAQTVPDFSTLARSTLVPWSVQEPGFKVEIVATGFQLPVNLMFVANPAAQADAPFLYVAELYGTIRVVRRDGSIGTYASNLLNFDPTGEFPGSGEQGLAGLTRDPVTGDLFGSLLYDAAPPNGNHYPKVVRFHSTDGGRTAATQTTILDMAGETQGQSHQISSLTIGPDGKLYVHMGDGFDQNQPLNLDSFRGKVLRMNLDGTAPSDNPFYNATNGITARDYVFAYGLRNPFGGAWRAADNKHYEAEDGPSVDRLARIDRGASYAYDGTDESMATRAIWNWTPSVAPVNIAFVQMATQGGSRFPASKMDHAFVTESGPTWSTGPQELGKKISEFAIDANGALVSGPTTLIEYNGSGKATCAGLKAGPDGLYFTDLYQDEGYQTPIDPGANVLRIRYVGIADFAGSPAAGPAPLTVHFTDHSTVPGATSWQWMFGDGAVSSERNPTHVYTQDGVYNVRLVASGPGGSAVGQKNALIRVGNIPKVAILGSFPDPMPDEQAVADHFRGLGFVVDVYADDPSTRPTGNTLASLYNLVVITSQASADTVGNEFRQSAIPMIFWNPGMLATDREPLASTGSMVPGATSVNVLNTGHPLMNGVPPGALTVFQPGAGMSVGLGSVPPSVSVLAQRSGAGDAAVLAVGQGATLSGGYVTPGRRVFFFLNNGSFLSASAGGIQLLDRAACWAGAYDPAISQPPRVVSPPSSPLARIQVAATGAGPISYQWRRDGVALSNGGRVSGADAATLVMNPVMPGDTGSYDVIVSNCCGLVTSSALSLSGSCYVNCDGSTTPPILNVADLLCFTDRFMAGDPYANCDGSTAPPTLNIYDFICFVQRFSEGCP